MQIKEEGETRVVELRSREHERNRWSEIGDSSI
jgi:hypothetical protein